MTDWEQAKQELMGKGSGSLPSQIKGKIIECKMTTAGEQFGDKVRPFENEDMEHAKSRPMVQIIVDTGFEFDVRESFYLSMNQKSNMGKFHAMYGKLPEVDMEVNLIKRPGKDGRSYYKILI